LPSRAFAHDRPPKPPPTITTRGLAMRRHCSTRGECQDGPVEALAVAASLALAFILGVSDAPNASSALVASRTAGYRAATAFAFVFHALGGFVSGTAVALTITTLIQVPPGD